jgi:hypothetical protein
MVIVVIERLLNDSGEMLGQSGEAGIDERVEAPGDW